MTRRVPLLYLALATADVLLAARGHRRPRAATKPLLMPALAVGKDASTRRALAFGTVGDVTLLGSGDVAFTAGLTSFFAGHLAWMRALRSRDGSGLLRRQPWAAAPYVAGFAVLNVWLWSRTGRDRLPVLCYSGALLGTALVALDTGDARSAAGGALFLTSDTLLALEKFGDVHLPGHEALVMATYTVGQALLAAGGAIPAPALPR